MLSSLRSRLPSAARWLAPSVVAACAGALAAGAWEAIGVGGLLGGLASAGFLAIVAVPLLVLTSALVRGLWAAWQPEQLAAGLVEDGGGSPRLAGWALVIALGCVALAWALFQSTWLLATWTAFKPFGVSLAQPVIAVMTALIALAASRPAARLFAHLARKLDARWRAGGHRTLLTPRKIVFAIAAALLIAAYVVWRVLIKKRLGPLDTSVFESPAIGLVATALAHAVWGRLGAVRRTAGTIVVALAGITIATALYAWRAEPSLTLAIWGERPVAGLAVDKLFDLDRIRARVSLAQFRPSLKPGAAHPDIILVTIDTVRADHTPPYGGAAEMPALRDIAQKGVVFEWAFAPSNVTRRSIPSMTIGLAPNRVRGRVVGWALRVDPRHVMLAERLAAGGYETAGFMCCEGFWGSAMHTGLQRGLEHLEIEPSGLLLAKRARAWLDAREKHPTGKPLFLWMHILEPHNWGHGVSDGTSDEDRKRTYDRTLAASDAMLVELLGAFGNRPPEQTPIVIVSADHGEALGDHGQPFHSTDLYNSQIHVPFVIAGPGIRPGRISETVSLTDLTPTLVELAGFEAPTGPSIDGRSLVDLATGKRASDPEHGVAFAAMIKDRSNPGGVSAIIRGRYKLIDGPSGQELYDVRADPDERSNVISTHGHIAEELRKLLREHLDAAKRSPF